MNWYLSVRYWFYAFPAYISETVYHAPRYTFFREVAARLLEARPFDDRATVSRALKTAVSTPIPVSGTLSFFPADEKGTVDFVRLAFMLFGVDVESVFGLYVLLLVASAALFVIRFRDDVAALFVGVIAGAALLVMVCALP